MSEKIIYFNLLDNIEKNYIIRKILKLSYEQILISKEKIVANNIMEKIAKLYLINKKPLSKIFREKAFWTQNFYTNKNTLDPRPETEGIIEQVLKIYNKDDFFSVLDLGSGTGCIGLSILTEFPNAKLTMLDISYSALKIAKYNTRKLNLLSRANFIRNNWLNDFNEKYDLLVSNPPYLTKNQINSNYDVLKYDPYIALYDETGLSKYHDIYNKKHLFKHIILEISFILKENIHHLFQGQIITNDIYYYKNN